MTQHTSRELQSEAGHSGDSQDAFDGELVTAPWLGLHYVTETP
ncbi:hypothetical protein ACFVTE_13650 [Arthrobacter sp. NPDC058097]